MAEFIKLYEENPHPPYIQKIIKILKKGGIIIYPTDTVYALGCDITNFKALEKISIIKGVKLAKSNFSFVCSDFSNLSHYTKQVDNSTYKILKRGFPGPFTFILKGSNNLPKVFKSKKNVGIRIPDSNITRSIVEALGNPIVTTSIHHEDEIIEYMTDPEEIFYKYQKIVDVVIDAGYGGNIPSTVVNLSQGEIELFRQGKGDLQDIL